MQYYVNKEFFETSKENITLVEELNARLPPSRRLLHEQGYLSAGAVS
jgi:hypothetical protein